MIISIRMVYINYLSLIIKLKNKSLLLLQNVSEAKSPKLFAIALEEFVLELYPVKAKRV